MLKDRGFSLLVVALAAFCPAACFVDGQDDSIETTQQPLLEEYIDSLPDDFE